MQDTTFIRGNEKKTIKTIEKTKKRKNTLSSTEKAKIWETFQSESNPSTDAPVVNCVYQSPPTPTNVCTSCGSGLMVMEDGFPTCLNKSCGMVYTDTLDYSPEWRYFGADDKNANDPTRCGNPINPLLEMSSYGCKVLHTPKSSKEMMKIGKWIAWHGPFSV
jgi:hypothetical protein